MIPLKPPLRPATEADAPQLAELVNMAGHGLPLHVWTELAGPDEDPWALGRARQAGKAREGQIVVVDHGAGAVACLTGYRIGAAPVPVGPDVPALFRPLLELENAAPDSWYVNVLAVYPEARGEGLGSRLLAVAERIGRAEGASAMSVIVADDNPGARRLYERSGYAEAARRPCETDGWDGATREWVLLTKPL